MEKPTPRAARSTSNIDSNACNGKKSSCHLTEARGPPLRAEADHLEDARPVPRLRAEPGAQPVTACGVWSGVRSLSAHRTALTLLTQNTVRCAAALGDVVAWHAALW